MTHVFHLSVYALTALAAVILVIGEEGTFFPSGLTIPLSFIAWFSTERLRRLRLPVRWANALGVAAFVLSGIELYDETLERRVLAGAHLLAYLSWIALFQDKRGRQYWWLLALGVMQVAVASILTEREVFGVLLVLYVFCALWTLALYSVYQAEYGFEQGGRTTAGEPATKGGPATDDQTLLEPGLSVRRRTDDSGFALVHSQPDEFRSAIQLDPTERWINFRFVMGVFSTSFGSLIVGLLFFLLIPRMWAGSPGLDDLGDPASMRMVSGFSREVQLGEIGQILESNKPVLQVRFFDEKSREELDVEETGRQLGYSEPLFRGSVMGRYVNGRWQVLPASRNVAGLYPPQQRGRDRIVQNYLVTAPTSRMLFGMHPVFGADRPRGEKRISVDVVTSMIMRDKDGSGRGSFEYSLYSGIPRRGPLPYIRQYGSVQAQMLRVESMAHFLDLPDDLANVRRIVQQIEGTLSISQFARERPLRLAEAIERHLRDSGEFAYSLTADVVDSNLDPVEDFLVNRKSGHCEYYASAMALMLRAASIPSRLVSGFKGGEKNDYSGVFVVEERHAHAWVEAYIDRRWRTFDPTPAGRDDSVREIGEDRGLAAFFRDIVSGMWYQRVVRLSLNEQRRGIYVPLANTMEAITRDLTGNELNPQTLIEFLRDPSRWFSLSTFAITFGGLAALFLFRAVWRRAFPPDQGVVDRLLSLIQWIRDRVRDRRATTGVEFYESFLRILGRQGLAPRRGQTPLEFAVHAEAELAAALANEELRRFPNQLVRRFYAVRFGNTKLSSSEQRELQVLLSQLRSALAADGNKAGP